MLIHIIHKVTIDKLQIIIFNELDTKQKTLIEYYMFTSIIGYWGRRGVRLFIAVTCKDLHVY